MRSQETRQPSGRGQRRGPGRGQRGRSSRRGADKPPAPPRAPEKETLWEKITSFFKPKKAPQRQNGHVSEPSQRAPRKPEIVEVSSAKLYVGNLSFDAAESDLFDLFNGVGSVQNAEIVSNKYTHKSKGFAFVTMQSIDEARRAVVELHDKEFMGRKLLVSGAKSSEFQPGRGGR